MACNTPYRHRAEYQPRRLAGSSLHAPGHSTSGWFLIKRQAVDLLCVEDVRHEHFRPLQAHANLDRIALTVQHWFVVLVALGLFFFKLPILDGCAFSPLRTWAPAALAWLNVNQR
jgi:hypothetical protein